MTRCYKGEDVPIRLTVLNSAGIAIVISSVESITLAVVHRKSGKVIARFAFPELIGYSELDVIDNEEGQIRVVVPRSSTQGAEEGEYNLQIKIKSEINGFPENQTHRMGEYPNVFYLYPSKLTTA